MKLVIQIPAFNEAENIGTVLSGILTCINRVDFVETIVVNDGSTDKTIQIARDHNIKHIVDLPRHVGLGRAFREGLKYARSIGADIMVNIDADNQYSGSDIHEIIKPILDGKADMVIGDRQLSKIPGYPRYKLISQSIGNILVSNLFYSGIKDATSGFRALTRDAADLLAERSKNDYTYTLESICLLLKNKKRISFVPVNIRHPTRKSKLITSRMFYVKNFLTTLLKCYISSSNA